MRISCCSYLVLGLDREMETNGAEGEDGDEMRRHCSLPREWCHVAFSLSARVIRPDALPLGLNNGAAPS